MKLHLLCAVAVGGALILLLPEIIHALPVNKNLIKNILSFLGQGLPHSSWKDCVKGPVKVLDGKLPLRCCQPGFFHLLDEEGIDKPRHILLNLHLYL